MFGASLHFCLDMNLFPLPFVSVTAAGSLTTCNNAHLVCSVLDLTYFCRFILLCLPFAYFLSSGCN